MTYNLRSAIVDVRARDRHLPHQQFHSALSNRKLACVWDGQRLAHSISRPGKFEMEVFGAIGVVSDEDHALLAIRAKGYRDTRIIGHSVFPLLASGEDLPKLVQKRAKPARGIILVPQTSVFSNRRGVIIGGCQVACGPVGVRATMPHVEAEIGRS